MLVASSYFHCSCTSFYFVLISRYLLLPAHPLIVYSLHPKHFSFSLFYQFFLPSSPCSSIFDFLVFYFSVPPTFLPSLTHLSPPLIFHHPLFTQTLRLPVVWQSLLRDSFAGRLRSPCDFPPCRSRPRSRRPCECKLDDEVFTRSVDSSPRC